ncbi:TauD/TfdA family dioxygenase [Embleya sp. NPDC005575]|uniref:TauD/TfdA family dioxygenase n=1 Tax=Embleya sp. NPDC005575 TaxID=3156892 RepID=UPI0033B3705F
MPKVSTLPDVLDVRDPQGVAGVGREVREHGMALVLGADSRRAVLRLAEKLMATRPHPDADPDGATVIHDIGAQAHTPGYAGLGAGELLHHTERSQLPYPPRLMLLVCVTPATSGGECRLVDGRAVLADLAHRSPDAAHALAAPRSAFFGRGDGHLGSVFARVNPGHWAIRLRQDELARFSPAAHLHLALLREVIEENTVTVETSPGCGYVIDNHRWLHARAAFTGDRTMLRVLGDPLPRLALRAGFTPAVPRDGALATVAG